MKENNQESSRIIFSALGWADCPHKQQNVVTNVVSMCVCIYVCMYVCSVQFSRIHDPARRWYDGMVTVAKIAPKPSIGTGYPRHIKRTQKHQSI